MTDRELTGADLVSAIGDVALMVAQRIKATEGLCQCGCRGVAPIVKESNAKRRLVAGQPYRFIHGHNARRAETPAQRLWSRVDKTGSCWLWTGATNNVNYGQIRLSKKVCVMTHRLAWEVTNGEIPGGLCVLHRCDNPPCCNPAHLFLGTKADNSADMVAKGRHTNVPKRLRA